MMGRCVNAPRRRSGAEDDLLEGVPHVSMDYGFLGQREQVSPVLVTYEWRHKMTWAMLVPRKGTEFPRSQREQGSSSTNSGTTESRSEGNRTRSPRRKPDCA